MPEAIVDVVHCIDTEGPLYESISATFERLRYIFDINLEPTEDNLGRLQRGEIDLGGNEAAVRAMLAPDLLAFNDTWDKINVMLREIMSPEYRKRYSDSFGNGWIYNWHCVDHVGYVGNPRRRDMGYLNIFDHYQDIIRETASSQDGVHFHYHPLPYSGQANHCASHWFAHSDTLFQSVARRLIDRLWFPSVNRPGFHTIRPDSHWFLEQFIPFDYSNQSYDGEDSQPDFISGRFGDWRRAPRNWQPYQPAHDDYQSVGNCRRSIFRCLNIGMRTRVIRQTDVDQAFAEALQGKPVVLAFADHDYRDMRPDVEMVHAMLNSASDRYQNVKFRYSEGRDAARRALGLIDTSPCQLRLEFNGSVAYIESDKPIFGPQPFLALKTLNGDYRHDNLDIDEPFKKWSYVMDEQSISLDALEAFGVGACDKAGSVSVAVWRRGNDEVTYNYF